MAASVRPPRRDQPPARLSAADGLCYLSLAELAGLIRRRRVSPVEATRAVLARIAALDPQLVAYVTVLAEPALAAAARAEREIVRGRYRGPLHGVPVSLKDVIATRGVRTTNGSRATAARVPDEDATVAACLAAAGAVLIGKTTLYEFATGPPAEAPLGIARNPWDPARLTGGSSTGSAAALAAGLCHASVGTDTGGSIRIPASLCGIVGLKPTRGRVSRHGITPLSPTLDHAGPMARTVRDAALLLQVLAGHDPLDAASASCAVPSYTRSLGRSLDGLRVGVLGGHFERDVDPEVGLRVEAAVAALERLGARPHRTELTRVADAFGVYWAIMPPEAVTCHAAILRERAHLLGPGLLERLRPGHSVLATRYLEAQWMRGLIADEARRALDRASVLIAPTTPIPAPRFDELDRPPPGGGADIRTALSRFTTPFNVTGLPAISVPCGFTSAGLPVGLQIIGRPFDEATVLRVAHAYEQAQSWRARRPAI
jgi:aspartyl-tRNA(Asn)/glutamyl-tRNA(Gln) amidotransferase subunit A